MADDNSSSSSSDAEFDFEEQLRLERLEKEQRSSAASSAGQRPTRTDPDGTVYEWDEDRKAWFPKVDEDFLAYYHSNYGVAYDYENMPGSTKSASRNESVEQPSDKPPENSKGNKKKRNKDKTAAAPSSSTNTWFEVSEDKNTSVYVSNLPLDFTEEEFVELMQKCGLILLDPFNKKPKIKLYHNEDGSLKGDGRCCYIKVESVALALQILDGWTLRDNKTVHVERAKFEIKGPEFNPAKRGRKLTNKEKRAIKDKQTKLFDWRPEKLEIQRGRNERVAVIKHMFTPNELDTDPDFYNELNDDVKQEAAKCGAVKRVVICDRNPDGVVMVYFKTPEEADKCIETMNGRWYGAKQLQAFAWDGKTKYHVEETEEERAKRLEKWYNFLEQSNQSAAGASSDATAAPSTAMSQPVAVLSETHQQSTSMENPLTGGNESSGNGSATAVRHSIAKTSNDSSDLSDNSNDDAAFNSTDEEDNE